MFSRLRGLILPRVLFRTSPSAMRPAARPTVWLPALAVLAFASLYLPLASLLVKVSTPSESVAAAANHSTQTAAPANNTNSTALSTLPTCTPAASTEPNPLLLDSRQNGLSVQIDPTATYHIYGTTADDLRNQIQHCAPGARSGSLAEFTAKTSYNLSWQYSEIVRGSSCQLIEPKVGVHIQTTLPGWQASSAATPGLYERWQTFLTGLISHEQGHAALDRLYAAKLTTDLGALGPVDCRLLTSAAKTIVQADVAALNQANTQYDQQTGHGTTQGAVLPAY